MKRKRRNRKLLAILGWILVAAFVLSMVIPALFADAAETEENYGADAYYYVNYLQTNYPERAVANPNLDAAAAWLKQQINTMGYEYGSQPFSVPMGEYVINGENLFFSKRGADDRVIVVGAHYDSVLTRGTDDNASGVGVLLETAQRVSAGSGYPFTIRFVLFSAEEPGCVGSRYYVDQLSEEERARILCMINLDTLGGGDQMYLYGGNPENGTVVRTWLVEQALEAAELLGLDMKTHPDVNPEFPVPAKQTASDQEAFNDAGIPYLYCEASNWNGGPMTNFFQTDNPAVPDGKMMHVAEFESLEFYNRTFGTRFRDHLAAYAELLDYLLKNLVPDAQTGSLSLEDRNETVHALSDVRIRRSPSTEAEVLDVLEEGETILRTGFSEDWSRVAYGDGIGYVKTEFLEADEELTDAPETESEDEESEEASEEISSDEILSEEDSLTEAESGPSEVPETDEDASGESAGQEDETETEALTEEEHFGEAASEESGEAESGEKNDAEPDSKAAESSAPESSEKEPQEVILTAADGGNKPDSRAAKPAGSPEEYIDHAVSHVKETARTLTNSVNSVFSDFSPEAVTRTIRQDPVLAGALIAGVVMLAVILCLIIYLFRVRSGKK